MATINIIDIKKSYGSVPAVKGSIFRSQTANLLSWLALRAAENRPCCE